MIFIQIPHGRAGAILPANGKQTITGRPFLSLNGFKMVTPEIIQVLAAGGCVAEKQQDE
jgi:hypothetical protein